MSKILKPLLVLCQGTCALGKLHLRQSPKPCSSMVAAFCELLVSVTSARNVLQSRMLPATSPRPQR